MARRKTSDWISPGWGQAPDTLGFYKNKAEVDGWRLLVRRSEVKGLAVGLGWFWKLCLWSGYFHSKPWTTHLGKQLWGGKAAPFRLQAVCSFLSIFLLSWSLESCRSTIPWDHAVGESEWSMQKHQHGDKSYTFFLTRFGVPQEKIGWLRVMLE